MRRFLGLLLCCACQGRASPQPSAAEPAEVAPPPPAAIPERAHGLQYHLPSPNPSPLDLPGIGQLITADKTEVQIDLEDGTRVTAAPHTRLCALAFAPSLVLVSGLVRVVRLPDAAHAGVVAGRVATLAGALESSASTEAMLRVETQGKRAPAPFELRSQLQLERGAATWLSLDDALQETPLSAGSVPARPIEGLHWLAVAQGRPLFDAAFRKLAWSKQASQEDTDRALDLALTEQEALRERGHELLASVSPRHAALAKLARDGSTPGGARPDAASTREYQKALVEHAQRSHTHAAQLLLAAERSLLTALLACGADVGPECASLQLWSARFSTRVASLL